MARPAAHLDPGTGPCRFAAAVGARRAGYHRPLPMAVLERMYPAYLAERGGPDLRPEPFPDAARWALAPAFASGANSSPASRCSLTCSRR